ncbi:MAG: RtcB family protein [Fidelibacterota bacterium]|nr:MAG: RtcB family protein [Candidatus Neomarinimicrobiota bacterium]
MFLHRAGGSPIKIWADPDQVEPDALRQLERTSRLPFIFKHLAVMPDVHLGLGATIGCVMATTDAIVPAAVGVDIGCGMLAVQLHAKADNLPDSLEPLRTAIERAIPMGTACHLNDRTSKGVDFGALRCKGTLSDRALRRAATQVGTLGGGNHFIELCLDPDDNVWTMLHSGSRYIGKTVADIYIRRAKELMQRRSIRLEDPDLAYLDKGSSEFKDYVHDLFWCQQYAALNRQTMFDILLRVIQAVLFRDTDKELKVVGEVISCHHNYTALEKHFGKQVYVTRKGAMRAQRGELGIIPGSMGAKSYIVRGRGNSESYNSCSHGAGRRMSRTRARKQFSRADLVAQTEGIVCRKDKGVLDEVPAAYKDIDEVMAHQADLVEEVTSLKQLLCAKG